MSALPIHVVFAIVALWWSLAVAGESSLPPWRGKYDVTTMEAVNSSSDSTDTLTTTLKTDNTTTQKDIVTEALDTTVCPELCDCFWTTDDDAYGMNSYLAEGDSLTTNCIGLRFTEIPPSMDTLTRKLWLNRNQISVLRNYSLSHLGASLRNLDLSDNQLVMIESVAFWGLQSLRWLWLDRALQPNTTLHNDLFHPLVSIYFVGLRNCYLRAIPADFFSENPEVYCIYLSNNELNDLPHGLFRGLTDTTEIFLDNNNISYLPNDMFKGDNDLTRIQLHNNSIATLSENVGLQTLSSLETLTLYGNPFSCTCALDWFSQWVDSFLSQDSSDALECLVPNSRRGMKLASFHREVDCSRRNVNIGASVSGLVMFGLILGVILYRYRWDLR